MNKPIYMTHVKQKEERAKDNMLSPGKLLQFGGESSGMGKPNFFKDVCWHIRALKTSE